MMRPGIPTRSFLLLSICLLLCGCRSGAPSAVPATQPIAASEIPDEAGLRAFLDAAIARANLAASEIDDKTYVQHLSLRRAVYFVPAPPRPKPGELGKEIVIPDTELSDGPGDPPKEAVERSWTDHYTLAQQFSYRYVLVHAGPVVPDEQRPGDRRAKVILRLIAGGQVGMHSDEQPIPEPPDGMEIWHPSPWGQGSRFYGVGGQRRDLPTIQPPGSQPDPQDQSAQRAIAAMQLRPLNEDLIDLQAGYNSRTRRWVLPRRVETNLRPHELSERRLPRDGGFGVITLGPVQPATQPSTNP